MPKVFIGIIAFVCLVPCAHAVTIYLQVSTSVSALQCDLSTTGAAQITSNLGTTKQLVSARLPNGKLRIIVYGLNQTTFIGTFASVNAKVNGISNTVTSSPSGLQTSAVIGRKSNP